MDQLSLEALAAATAAADLHVGPDSGPMHLAAAFDVPAVVIFGGYIEPSCTSYPGNIDLYSPVPCAPCWLTELCPFGHPCLHQITPQQVEEALKQLSFFFFFSASSPVRAPFATVGTPFLGRSTAFSCDGIPDWYRPPRAPSCSTLRRSRARRSGLRASPLLSSSASNSSAWPLVHPTPGGAFAGLARCRESSRTRAKSTTVIRGTTSGALRVAAQPSC